jgi:hypothetical protein
MGNWGYGSTKDLLLAILLAGVTAACSATLPSTQLTPASAVPPADYRKIISTGVPATISKEAQVSELQRTKQTQPGDWFACLKSEVAPVV